MNKLTEQEFQDRVQAVARARAIFNNLTGNNITNSFEAYQLILAEQERPLVIDTNIDHPVGTMILSPMDGYQRPKCPDCNSDMRFRQLPQNDEGFKTQLVCSNPKCPLVLNSEDTLEQWIEKLDKK